MYVVIEENIFREIQGKGVVMGYLQIMKVEVL